MIQCDKLDKLRALMKQEGIDVYIITRSDPHQSEYISDYWNGVKFISGFSGSNGTVVVTDDTAGLWTDGRYYIQAQKELEGSGIILYKASQPDTITVEDFCLEYTDENGLIGFDARTMSAERGLFFSGKRQLKTDIDLLSLIWENRGEPYGKLPVFEHDIKFCGKTREEKLSALQKEIKRGYIYVISSLDDIAWLFNLRGRDIENSTVFYSFAIISCDSVCLYVDNDKISPVKKELERDGVTIRKYEDIYEDLVETQDKRVLINTSRNCYNILKNLNPTLIEPIPFDITTIRKAVKNKIEIKNIENAYIRDSVVLIKFIKWLKENAGHITELEIEEELLKLRSAQENFICPSFSTIAAYMENAAIVHYSADRENPVTIQKNGMVLVDSGGHYLDGTTDATRTIVLGEIDKEMKRDFTLVLKSHIAFAKTTFLYGVTGVSIDAIARAPMWAAYKNYNHGTGHGIGFCLSVHEGPQSISMRLSDVKLEVGMLVSNEPGIYLEGKYGIRTENVMLIEEASENDFGKFLKFRTLTLCPIDMNGIDEDILTEDEKLWIKEYHEEVYKKLSPFLNTEEREFLRTFNS